MQTPHGTTRTPGHAGQALTLQPLAPDASGNTVPPLELRDQATVIAGRSSETDWTIADQAVSRRHASFTSRAGEWFVTDLRSRHGTRVNGRAIEPGLPVPIAPGDRIEFGVWACRCRAPGERHFPTTTFDERAPHADTVSPVQPASLDGLAQRRLDALLTVSRELNSARSLDDVATSAVRAVHAATGGPRVVVVQQASDREFAAIASSTDEPPTLSRTLVEAAAGGQLVELRDNTIHRQAHSILDLGIRTAICAPIMVGQTPEAFLYLDSRKAESVLPEDAAAFCQSVAQLAGLALERVRAAELSARHAQLESDLSAARRAQQLLMPPRTGTLGPVSYAYESLAGRVVAGDLFDVFSLDQQRTALFLGDVSGKGVGAAVLMAAAQSQLRTRLASGRPLAEAVASVSADIHSRSEANKFVTCLAAIIHHDDETIELVDAGHGFAARVSPDRRAEKIQTGGGFPLGVTDSADYEPSTVPFPRGATLVLFSDGVIEQPDPAGVQFGYDNAIHTLHDRDTPEALAAALLHAVRRHAAGGESVPRAAASGEAGLADDLTVAAVRLNAP
ncbi:MAG: SpoIIE family protein phosphatase [Phycisphaerales bacterium JB040]